MNASLSDGNEPVIDIFILSANSPLSTKLEKQLREEGYAVTLFTEGTHLLETLRNGKPNLLMCDTTSADADAFEVCRQIKADDFLWNIPVLIITGAADLGDLLRVLDSNADNFIAHPFDLPYLLSLIEGMLTVPVERPTPEQIKTQFKIKHDNQVFVVTADRRRLLEFLLSSFEIAVNKSTDLSRAQENIQNLGLANNKLEDTVHDNTRVIGIINETLRTKEQTVAELTGQLADREQTIREKIAAIDQASRNFFQEQSSHAETRSEFERVTKEKDEALANSQSAIDQLQQQVSGLASELAMLKPALERTQEELLSESSRRQETENTLSATASEKDQVEQGLLALTAEFEQLKVNLGVEKNRVQEAGHELKAVLQAKTQSEEDLTQVINGLKNTATEQAAAMTRLREESAAGIARLKENLESEHSRLQQVEQRLNTVTVEKEQVEASLRATIDAGQKDLASLQVRLTSAQSLLEEKEQEIKTLSDELVAAGSARESLKQELASVSRALAETKTALEAETRNTAAQKEDLAGVYAEKGKVEALAESRAGSLKELQDQLEQEKGRYRDNDARMNAVIQQRDRDLEDLRRVNEDARTAVSSHKTSLEEMKAIIQQRDRELEDLRRVNEDARTSVSSHKTSLEEMKTIIQQRDRDLEDLRRLHEDTRTTVSSHKTSLEQMQRELDSGVFARTELEEKLGLAEEKMHRISKDLESTSEARKQEKQQLSALADELERAKTNLENESVRRQEAEDQLRDALSQQQQLEQDVERFVSETKALQADLTAERRMHEAVKQQNQSLEEQVSSLSREKLQAEQAAADLTAEIDQARVALADEWENHMTDNERLAEAPEKKPQPGSAPLPGMRKEAGIIKKRALIVKVPTVPAEISPLSHAIVAVDPVKATEPETPHITSVEDLFEDDEDETEKPAGEPVVSIIQEPATEPVQDVLPDTIPGRSDEQDDFFENDVLPVPDARDTADEDETGDADSLPEQSDTAPFFGQNIAFNREQWFGLLKWSHHCEGLTQDQRMQIVRMGRLIQKGRKLTRKQEEQVLEMVALVQRLGYRIS